MRSNIGKVALVVLAALSVVFAAVYYLRSPSGGNERASSGPYNLVIVVSDALRQDAVGCYGGEARTPNIDALARRGALFENAYSTSPWTTPSSVSMFTGNHATSYAYSDPSEASAENLMRIYVPHSERLFMEVLRESGYATTMAVENGNAELHNNLQGLDPLMVKGSFREIIPPTLEAQITSITGTPLYRSKEFVNAFIVFKHLLGIPHEGNFAFLFWMLDPHQPYAPMDKYRARIDVDTSRLSKPKEYFEGRVFDGNQFNDYDQAYAKALYKAEIESVDERVGSVLKILEYKGLLDNTFVVFTSDHGEQFGDHGLYGHGGFGHGCHYYEGLMRVPLIISGPGIQKGRRIKTNVSLIDLMPTLKDLLDVEYEDEMQGVSRAPALLHRSDESNPLYFDDVQEHDQVDALLDGAYKLIFRENGTVELYDVSRDRNELDNVARARPDIVKSMTAEVLSIRNSNAERKKRNITAIDENMLQLSEEERHRITEQLKSLGYIR